MQVSESIRWKNRKAMRQTNGVVELISLTGGGHFAEFRLLDHNGAPSPNTIWEAPWVTFDPGEADLSPIYGPENERKFLAGYTGHCICIDFFGGPTPEQAAAGLSLHGEAASAWWDVSADATEGPCRWSVKLPSAQLTLEREIRLGEGESVAYVRETVTNHAAADHTCDWVHHATFGPPLLKESESTLSASAQRGRTGWPVGYDDASSMLLNDREFVWPHAPRATRDGLADLSKPFCEKGRGFIAGVQLDPRRATEYVLAVNWKLRLGVGYVVRRADFPWMTLWEENCGRTDAPWNGRSQARGMEFGTAPRPAAHQQTVRNGAIFDTPFQCVIPASGKKTAQYIIFLVAIPAGVDSIQDVEATKDAIVFFHQAGKSSFSIPAGGCEKFLSAD
jgi:hypothetical protein